MSIPDFSLITSPGLVCLSICTSLPLEEAVERANAEYPTEIASDWSLSEDEMFACGRLKNGCACESLPETHKHYLLNC